MAIVFEVQERTMKMLSGEDMRRILSSGEPFLLVDVRPVDVAANGLIPKSIQIPFGHGVVAGVNAATAGKSIPIVVCGQGAADPSAEDAAERRLRGSLDLFKRSKSMDPKSAAGSCSAGIHRLGSRCVAQLLRPGRKFSCCGDC